MQNFRPHSNEPALRTRTPNRHSTSRRALVRGAAWSAPVVAVATAAPAFAKSCVPQQVVVD